MRKTTVFYLLFLTVLCLSCRDKRKTYDEIGSSGLTTRTENLQANIRTLVNKGVLIGQQYGTLEGVGWRGDSLGRSDMRSICHDGPACSGYELCGVERGLKMNTDSIAFEAIREDALRLFKHGGLILMSWTMPDYRSDNKVFEVWMSHLADYLASLQDDYGIKAPVLLFPCPQDGKSWYTKLSPEAYKALFEKITDRLRSLGATNVLYGSSWTSLSDRSRVELSLPEEIDVLHLSLLQIDGRDTTYQSCLNRELAVLMEVAQLHNLAPGLTTGIEGLSFASDPFLFTNEPHSVINEPHSVTNEGLPVSNYFSDILLPVLRNYRLSYVLLGANRGEARSKHFHVPYPGCDERLIDDFIKFYNDDSTIFLKDLNGLYLRK